MPTRTFLPDWLFWDGALRSGLALEVSAEGRVLGARDALALRDAGDGSVERLPGRALLPGMVNAHSHAFQRLIRGRTEYVEAGRFSDDFWSWREAMYLAANALGPEDVYVASRQAFVEMAKAGITTVGEFHYLHHAPDGRAYADRNELARQVIRAARDAGLRIVLLRVAYARAGFAAPPNPRQRRFIDGRVEDALASAESLRAATADDDAVGVGLAPHSVRAVPREWLEAMSRAWTGTIHMHAAEQPAEIDACLREHRRRPIELASDVGLLGPRFTAVHGVHLSDGEVAALGAAEASVCACPTTERNLGDGIVPADALLSAGVHVSLGSDSQATIDLLEEARALELDLRLLRLRRAVLDPGTGSPSGLAARLLHAATEAGARSLGVEGGGALRPGAPADGFTVDLAHPSLVGAGGESLLSAIVFGAAAGAIRDVFVGGRAIVREGRHPLEEESGRAFSTLTRRIFG